MWRRKYKISMKTEARTKSNWNSDFTCELYLMTQSKNAQNNKKIAYNQGSIQNHLLVGVFLTFLVC